MTPGDSVVVVLGALLMIWPAVLAYSLFKPDPKPALGTFESMAGLIRGKRDEL